MRANLDIAVRKQLGDQAFCRRQIGADQVRKQAQALLIGGAAPVALAQGQSVLEIAIGLAALDAIFHACDGDDRRAVQVPDAVDKAGAGQRRWLDGAG